MTEEMITIETSFKRVEVPINDLTVRERAALSTLMGLDDVRFKAFEVLRGLPAFKRIFPKDVWAKCTQHSVKFPTELYVNSSKDMDRTGNKICQEVADLLPDADLLYRTHMMSGWCPRCKKNYIVNKESLMVKTRVNGIPFVMTYDVTGG